MTATVTLDNCAQEPIHIPSAIQPHGWLIACEPTELRIEQVSANAESVFGRPVAELAGVKLAELLSAESATALDAAVRTKVLREANPLRLVMRSGETYTASIHRSGERLVVELEAGSEGELSAFDPGLRASVVRLQSAHDVARLCQIASEEVRKLTGFDRVMVYRFDADWNGQVVAEAKREDLEPFLGLHYPASDIPAQARRLYTENWLRLIADIAYVPVPMVPALDPVTNAPLDMSHAALRSVSPIHVQYLKNMGVTASMSVSLVVDGQLAGLIACHHYSGAHLVSFTTRETAEYLGQALSWHLRVLETADEAERARKGQLAEAALMASLASAEELLDGLGVDVLVELADATGAAIVLEEGVRTVGVTPRPADILEIVEWLKIASHEVFATDHLAAHCPAALAWDDTAAGIIAVAISRELGEYLVWFRPATERVVEWAGDPRKSVVQSEGEPDRLSPRGSFALWRETVRGRSDPWERWQVEAAGRMRSVLLGGVRRRAAALRTVNERLREADRAKDTFIATVSHELRTPLNAINGWATLLLSGRVGADRTQHAMGVVARNTDTLKQLVEDLLDVSRIASGKLTLDVEEVELGPLVQNVVDALLLSAEAKEIRLRSVVETKESTILGDPTRVRQIVTNLVSNAVKFTRKGGKVTVTLRRVGSDIEVAVSDDGLGIDPSFLPHVFETFRQADGRASRKVQGLGLGLAIVKKLVELHGGRVIAESDGLERGATFRVRFPLMSVRRADPDSVAAPDTPRTEMVVDLSGVRVLVVEDERDSRELLVHMLEQCRAAVEAAPDASTALEILDRARFDVIVSDIGLPEMDGLALMRSIRGRHADEGGLTLAVALTAYTRAFDRTAALLAGFQAHVPKPADPQELVTVVGSLLGRLPSATPAR